MPSDIEALREWNKIEKYNQQLLLNNVFCAHCVGSTTIIDYDICSDKYGIVLRGKCNKCGGSVARVIENC